MFLLSLLWYLRSSLVYSPGYRTDGVYGIECSLLHLEKLLQLCFPAAERKERNTLVSLDWEKQFPVVSINRADLTEFGFTDEQIATIFTDEVMTAIAEKMQERYFLTSSSFFWEDMQQAVRAFTQVPHERRTIHGENSQPLREKSNPTDGI